jgi:ectoine hydroxylase-related dioxygenase (phytanoyl-CoA dioxygenase family)
MIDKQQYKQQGFLLLRSFLDPAELDTVRREAKDIFLIQMKRNKLIDSFDLSEQEFEARLYALFEKDFTQIVYCGKQAQHLMSLHRLSLNEKILRALKDLDLEFPVINVRPTIFFNSPHLGKRDVDWKKPAHQDWRTTQGSLDSLIVWVPLIDIDKSLGTLEIVPESHKLGLLQYEFENDYHVLAGDAVEQLEFIPLEVKKGDALLFSTLLVHRSGNNISGSIRWSCHFRYNNLLEPTFIERGFPHSYIYKPQDELISPGFPTADDVKRLFGSEPVAGGYQES